MSEAQNQENLKGLIDACSRASFHWADDTCREWGAAQRWQDRAYDIWNHMSDEERALVEPRHWGLVRKPEGASEGSQG